MSEKFSSHKKSKYWHPTKNGKIKPKDLSIGSADLYWFKCKDCKHDIRMSLNNVSSGHWCVYCSNNWKHCGKDDCKYCNDKSFLNHPKSKYWHTTKNNKTPRDVLANSNKKYWFHCEDCGHDFEKVLNNLVNDSWCKYCTHNWKHCGDKDCQYCFKKSFASHPKSKFWNTEKNKKNILEVAISSGKKYWFKCKDCKHELIMSPNDIFNGSWCKYCSVRWNHCGNQKCKFCFDRSFASHEKSKYWNSSKNKISPLKVAKTSGKKYWFDCKECGHSFKSRVASIIKGVWCGYCSVSWKHCGDKGCNYCFNRSFKSHYRSDSWNYEKNGNIDPLYIIKSKNTKFWFTCDDCGNSFEASINNVVTKNSWCSICKNKTEKKLYDFLKRNYDYNIETQKRFKWCKKEKCLPYDIVIEDLKLIIELDGNQHFKQVLKWKSHNDTQEQDWYKMEKAIENGYRVLRIYQEDVFSDKENWYDNLNIFIDEHIYEEELISTLPTSNNMVEDVYNFYKELNKIFK